MQGSSQSFMAIKRFMMRVLIFKGFRRLLRIRREEEEEGRRVHHTMAHYQGTGQEGRKAELLAKKREKEKQEFEKKRDATSAISAAGLKDMNAAFQTYSNVYEEEFKESTVGLVSAEDFKRKRIMLEKMEELEAQKRKEVMKKAKQKKKQERRQALNALSFDAEEVAELSDPDADEEGHKKKKKKKKKRKEGDEQDGDEAEGKQTDKNKKKKKDPTIETWFLPDKEREEEERRTKEALEREWTEEQDRLKAEKVEITYSYWDGSGHRRSITVPKGTRIDQFLNKCRQQLTDVFTELRGISSENLMYIKEDLIIPHHYTFYDLIVTKARGKSGPLFHFDVHDDVRMAMDSRVEKDESHAGKIVTRAWYERNQHIFPASRWEVYDPSKKYDKYTIKG
eukprot:g16706.t1